MRSALLRIGKDATDPDASHRLKRSLPHEVLHSRQEGHHPHGGTHYHVNGVSLSSQTLWCNSMCLPNPENIRRANVLPRYRQASESKCRLASVCPNLEELGIVQVSRVLAKPFSHLTLM